MSLISPEQVGAVLALQPRPHSFAELDARVSAGLPKAALRSSIEHVISTPAERTRLLHAIIPAATFKRRSDRLSPDESARAERPARIFATAHHVWDSEEQARRIVPRKIKHKLTHAQSIWRSGGFYREYSMRGAWPVRDQPRHLSELNH